MQILKPNTKPQRNNAHFQLNLDLYTELSSIKAETLAIKPQYEKWIQSFDKEDEALKKIRKSYLTEDIKEADRKRNKVFTGMMGAAVAALNHYDATISAAARRIQVVFDTYGNIKRMTIDEKTSAIYNFTKELTDHYLEDTETAGLKGWLVEIIKVNGALNILVRKRYDETANRTSLVVKKVRAEVDEDFRVLCICIEAGWVMAKDEEEKERYAEIIRKMNAIIEHYNNLTARKVAGSESAKGGDGNETATDTPDGSGDAGNGTETGTGNG